MSVGEAIRLARALAAMAQGEGWRDRCDAALIALALFCGLRRSEVAGLELAHVDIEGGVLRVVQGKGQKDRDVPLPPMPTLTAVLRAYLEWRRGTSEAPWFFLTKHGRQTNPRSVWDIVRRRVSPVLGRPINPHALRHGYATALVAGGGDLEMVCSVLGHESIATTQRHLHVTGRE